MDVIYFYDADTQSRGSARIIQIVKSPWRIHFYCDFDKYVFAAYYSLVEIELYGVA